MKARQSLDKLVKKEQKASAGERQLSMILEKIAQRGGKTRMALAALAGALCCLALPPLGWVPCLWLGLPLLLALLQTAPNGRQAFALGWCFAFSYFVLGLYWIAAALFVDIARYYWLVPFTVAGLPAALALYYALACWLWWCWRRKGVAGALWLALLLAAADYARGHLFTGFPWNSFGLVWADYLPMAQSVSLFGVYGLGLVTLLAACLPAALLGARRPAYGVYGANGVALAVLLLLGLWGAQRLQTGTAFVPEARVRLVQPNIAQALKQDSAQREANLQHMLALSATPAAPMPTHIIWPESAIGYFLHEDSGLRQRLAAALPAGALLLAGADRRTPNHATQRWDYFNSLQVLDTAGDLLTYYDKAHLVPFGEYVPLQGFAPVAAATAEFGSFTAGRSLQTLAVPGLPPFSPLICYEIIFSGAVAAEPRPQLLINITNDAWYGRTAGPYQHLAMARLRAIEEGVPLLRVANTGVSAVVDAYGRTLQSLPLGAEGIIDSAVPTALQAPPAFTKFGDRGGAGVWLLLLVAVRAALRHKANKAICEKNS